MPDQLVSVERVTKRFETVTAVDELSLEVRSGEIFALLGPNGAGKTTLVRMLAGVFRPDSGEIHYTGLGDAARELGYLPEERGLYADIPVLRTLVYFGVLRGMDRGQAAKTSMEWLERLELASRANEKLGSLSKGNQQKVQFISAVVHRPSFLILDEPFGGLDPVNQDFFLDVFRDLRARGTTILVSAHQMQLVERLADRMILINQGREISSGTLDEIRRRAAASRRILLKVAGSSDLGVLERHPALHSVTRTAEGDVELLLRDGGSLSGLLALAAERFEIREVHSEPLSLHDLFIQLVGPRRMEAES